MIRFTPAPLTVPPTPWRDEPPDRSGRWWLLAPGRKDIGSRFVGPGEAFDRAAWAGWSFAWDGSKDERKDVADE